MNLSELCIKRPVFATVLSLILIVVGILGFSYLNTRFMPKFEQKSVIISAFYPGASAKVVESSITTPLEEAMSGIEGIDTIQSQSEQGESYITVRLLPDTNIEEIANKIRNSIAVASAELPDTLKPPIVQAGWGNMELMDIGFVSTSRNVDALRDYLERYVINRISQVKGVANVTVDGANKLAMRIWLDPQKMAAKHISINDITSAIQNNNVELPAGQIKGDAIDIPITAVTKLSTAKQFASLVLNNDHGQFIRVEDVARVALGSDNEAKSIVKINGHLGVNLTVYNTVDANPLKTAERIKQLMQQIKQQLPSDIHIVKSFNQALYMKAAVREVYISIAIAIFFVALIIYLFLGRLRSTIIPLVTIPVCLLASFGVMYFLGFTINIITLLALVLAIGLVVDDAIVMMENIHRHMETGEKPLHAAIKGSKEITFPVIAMTLTLTAVYAPIGLIHGHSANIFRSFAYTLAGAVLISGFVALTLSPVMCAKLLKEKNKSSGFSLASCCEKAFKYLANFYQSLLGKILDWRPMVIGLIILIGSGGYFLFQSLPKAFMPPEDMGFLITVINTFTNESVDYTEKQLQTVSKIIRQYSAVESTMSFATTTAANFNAVFTLLKPYQKRKLSAKILATQINQKTQKYPELNATTFAPSFGSSRNNQLAFMVMGGTSYKNLYIISKQLVENLSKYPGLVNVKSNLTFDSQQYDISVNRNLASEMNVNIIDIDNALATLLGGSAVSRFSMAGQIYNVYAQAEEQYLRSIDSINQFYVKNKQNQFIPLSTLVSIKPIVSQSILPHYDRLRAAMISANLAPGYKIGTVIHYLQQHLPNLLPSRIKYDFINHAKTILQSSHNLGLLFILAVIFIYLVLSAQFESFIDPLIILIAVPLSIVGAMAALKLINGSLNIYTDIGLVTLIGLIAKHGILITQFANKLQQQGLAVRDAVIKATSTRLRPILMTTLAMIFGTLPLLFATGASATSRLQIGTVIISGLFFGTFFSLIAVPVVYTYAAKVKEKIALATRGRK